MSDYLQEIEWQIRDVETKFREINYRRESMHKEGRGYQENVYGKGSWEREFADLRVRESALQERYDNLNLLYSQESSRLDSVGSTYREPEPPAPKPKRVTYSDLAWRAARSYLASVPSAKNLQVLKIDEGKRTCKIAFQKKSGIFWHTKKKKIDF